MMLIYFVTYVNELKKQIYGKTYDVYDLSKFEDFDIPVWVFPGLGYRRIKELENKDAGGEKNNR